MELRRSQVQVLLSLLRIILNLNLKFDSGTALRPFPRNLYSPGSQLRKFYCEFHDAAAHIVSLAVESTRTACKKDEDRVSIQIRLGNSGKDNGFIHINLITSSFRCLLMFHNFTLRVKSAKLNSNSIIM